MQKLRSTQGMPIYSNKVPKFPHLSKEGQPTSTVVIDHFASWFLTSFCPEISNYDDNHRDEDLKYDWISSEKLMDKLRYDQSIAARSKLNLIHTTISGLKTDHSAKVMLSRYRKRDCDIWEVGNSSKQDFSSDCVLANEIDDLISQYHVEPLSNQDFMLRVFNSSYSQDPIKILNEDEQESDEASFECSGSSHLLDNEEHQQTDTLTPQEIMAEYIASSDFSTRQEAVIDEEDQVQ
eukprot:15358297-Ditylum_brightwellii.AAC.1